MALDVSYREERLDNGLVVLRAPAPARHTACLGLFVRAGTRFESAREAGVCHFLEHMVFRGAGPYPNSLALNLELERLGGPLEASTCRDSTSYMMRLDPDELDPALRLLVLMMTQPRYTGLAAERAIVLEELSAEQDEQGQDLDADNLSHAVLYPRHPLARRILGEARNLRRFNERDLEACREKFYVGHNLVAVLVGPGADSQAAGDALARWLGALPAGQAVSSRPPGPGPAQPVFSLTHDDDPQARVRLNFRGPAEDDPGFEALKLVLRILDDGVSTRLQNRICEELGLAYEVSAELVGYGDCSHLALDLTAAPEKMNEALTELFGVVEGLVQTPPDEAEQDKALRRHRLDLAAMLDDAWDLSQYLGYTRLLRQPESPEQRVQRMAAVTAAQLEQAARDVFAPGRLRAVIVGDLSRRQAKACRRIVEGWKGI